MIAADFKHFGQAPVRLAGSRQHHGFVVLRSYPLHVMMCRSDNQVGRARPVLGLATGLEELDDEHTTTAAGRRRRAG